VPSLDDISLTFPNIGTTKNQTSLDDPTVPNVDDFKIPNDDGFKIPLIDNITSFDDLMAITRNASELLKGAVSDDASKLLNGGIYVHG
jgi:hypothetical protein